MAAFLLASILNSQNDKNIETALKFIFKCSFIFIL